MTAKEQDIIRLQQELQQCRAALSGACLAASGQGAELPLAGAGPLFGSQPPGILGRRLVLDSTLELCKDGSCRVMAYSEYLTLLIVSYAGTNAHLTGTGVKKVNTLGGYRVCGYIAVHRKPIRDMAFHLEQNDNRINKYLHFFLLFFLSPVTTFPRGGLFVQRLQSCIFHESRTDGFVPHTLPLEGPFTSLSIEPETRHFLASSRPSSSHTQVKNSFLNYSYELLFHLQCLI